MYTYICTNTYAVADKNETVIVKGLVAKLFSENLYLWKVQS